MPTAATLKIDASVGACSATATAVGRLATHALVCEMELTPKPGLVDRANSGAHSDMDLNTFRTSVAAISPWFPGFFEMGYNACSVAAPDFLRHIRSPGIACERAMFAATRSVNTHKGSVFSFGLLCAAAGRVHGRGERLDAEGVCAEVTRMCRGMVARELRTTMSPTTAGESLYVRHGLTGARGEAQSGFATARAHGVQPYLQARADGMDDEAALFEALLHLMANNLDTNLVSRGGIEGLFLVQTEARRLLSEPQPVKQVRVRQLAELDLLLTQHNLSPGGSADLLAVSWFLANLSDLDVTTK